MATNPNPVVPPVPDSGNKKKLDFLQLLPNLIYGAIAVLLIVVIIWGVSGQRGFLTSLADRTVARGLITFLITFTTIGIAIILAISTLYGDGGDNGEKRFDQGKQVLGVLIGILGTIVGFYFGSSTDVRATPAAGSQVLAIAPAAISNSQPKKGEKFTITSFVYGGKAPYTYSISFDPALIPAIKDVKTTDGTIRQEVVVPDTLSTDTDVQFEIVVTDSDKKTADYNKDGAQKISLKAK
jgi:hypothetical protein